MWFISMLSQRTVRSGASKNCCPKRNLAKNFFETCHHPVCSLLLFELRLPWLHSLWYAPGWGASQTVALHTLCLHTDMLRPFAWLPNRMFLSGLLNWEILSSIQSNACSRWQGSSLLLQIFKLCDRGPSWANLLLNDLLWVLGFMFHISHSFTCCD